MLQGQLVEMLGELDRLEGRLKAIDAGAEIEDESGGKDK
jgi:hypothetical protein